jgi:bleomycin hydrolase
MTHAMVLTVGNPVRRRVQNSRSQGAGTDSWFMMSDKWMDEFVYQVIVEPRFMSKEVRDVLDKKAKVIPL